MKTPRRFIIHVDMDAFFAAIEQRDHPAYRGKPVVVGADPKLGSGRGVVSTCSYEARRFGIRSAMPISEAYRRCPESIFLPVDMERYADVSRRLFGIFERFTPEVEPISIDEAFLDITGSYRHFGTPHKTCLLLKETIQSETGLTASVGLAPIKMAAKIASDLKKPDGLVEVDRAHLLDFLRPLDIRKIWGLGPRSEVELRARGICTIGDLGRREPGELVRLFGKSGFHFWRLANGIDERVVEASDGVQSVGNETTFESDTADGEVIASSLLLLSEKVSDRLRHDKMKGRTVTLKVRIEPFETHTRSRTLAQTTNFTDTIYRTALDLFDRFPRRGRRVRLIGVKVSGLLVDGFRESLFEEKGDERAERVHKAVDRIRGRFGDGAIRRAGSSLPRSAGRLKTGI